MYLLLRISKAFGTFMFDGACCWVCVCVFYCHYTSRFLDLMREKKNLNVDFWGTFTASFTAWTELSASASKILEKKWREA